jgi:hypothetical protein
MARKESRTSRSGDDWLFPRFATEADLEEASLLDVIDNVLNHGVVLHGDLILGVANVDLIYAKLSLLLAALDKIPADGVRGPASAKPPGRPRRRTISPSTRKRK